MSSSTISSDVVDSNVVSVAPAKNSPAGETNWKSEVTERLHAHRIRRRMPATDNPPNEETEFQQPTRASRAQSIAASVAARYAQAPSYREVLEEQSRREAEQLSRSPAVEESDGCVTVVEETLAPDTDDAALLAAPTCADSEEAHGPAASIEGSDSNAFAAHQHDQDVTAIAAAVSGDDGVGKRARAIDSQSPDLQFSERSPMWGPIPDGSGNAIWTETPAQIRPAEIFSANAMADAIIEPTVELPANLIAFPRLLVAARKARPRLAEGPLRVDSPESVTSSEAQLRIFEVEPEQICREPLAAEVGFDGADLDQVNLDWSDLHLDHGVGVKREKTQLQARELATQASRTSKSVLRTPALPVASLERRIMAALVDLAIVLFGLVGFAATFAAASAHSPDGKPALITALSALFIFFLGYNWMFFTWSDATPGMRYARISLCTFDDENLTRHQRQWRISALLLSAASLGLGFAWAWFDEDHLGWHDRITRTYMRGYDPE